MSKALSRHGVNGSSSGKFSESEGRRGEKVVFIAKKLFSGGQILNSRSFNEPTTIESWIDGDTVGQSRYAKSVGSTAGSRYGNDRSRLRMLVRERVIFRPSPSLSLLHR